ncbi:MAG: exosortase system-associated protein, TIGR04073 family [Lentisphaerae bacterium]|nr:exosortase system-associated protein, TIGR04073 family [Lentisphaerota bacterium]
MKIMTRVRAVLAGAACLGVWGAAAVEDNAVYGMSEKFTHGLVNLATGWMELPMQIKKGYDRGVPAVKAPAGSHSLGTLQGLFRGVSQTLGRTGWGAWEMVTFWAPNHTSNADLMLLNDSVYAWEKGTMKPFNCPCTSDGFKRLGKRLERGVDDLFGGVMEVPGQIRKADAVGCPLPGIPKGLYYMLGRVVNGAGDIVLLPLPGPVDNLMVPFEEVKPWDAWDGRYYNNVP